LRRSIRGAQAPFVLGQARAPRPRQEPGACSNRSVHWRRGKTRRHESTPAGFRQGKALPQGNAAPTPSFCSRLLGAAWNRANLGHALLAPLVDEPQPSAIYICHHPCSSPSLRPFAPPLFTRSASRPSRTSRGRRDGTTFIRPHEFALGGGGVEAGAQVGAVPLFVPGLARSPGLGVVAAPQGRSPWALFCPANSPCPTPISGRSDSTPSTSGWWCSCSAVNHFRPRPVRAAPTIARTWLQGAVPQCCCFIEPSDPARRLLGLTLCGLVLFFHWPWRFRTWSPPPACTTACPRPGYAPFGRRTERHTHVRPGRKAPAGPPARNCSPRAWLRRVLQNLQNAFSCNGLVARWPSNTAPVVRRAALTCPGGVLLGSRACPAQNPACPLRARPIATGCIPATAALAPRAQVARSYLIFCPEGFAARWAPSLGT